MRKKFRCLVGRHFWVYSANPLDPTKHRNPARWRVCKHCKRAEFYNDSYGFGWEKVPIPDEKT